ncbi:MAG: hypothetical protein M1360_03275 [Candidatus Marsarchaeota archaeon]|jgi:hypothetical protein|nr:hypothetical protein [Candidatus Marsarchaeota archaeon]MCL5418934.1 hypothetical protein [Candidatus Marsarchaeota archaeon]
MAEKKNVVVIDPSIQYTRMLHYREKHSGWEIFKSIYWGIYILLLGLFVLSSSITVASFLGFALITFALFFIVYGFSVSLHLKLMKRYA